MAVVTEKVRVPYPLSPSFYGRAKQEVEYKRMIMQHYHCWRIRELTRNGYTSGYHLRVGAQKRPLTIWRTETAVHDFNVMTLLELNQSLGTLTAIDNLSAVMTKLDQLLTPPYPMTILERATYYWIELTKQHIFPHNNHFTAQLAMVTYLKMNAFQLDLKGVDLGEITQAIHVGDADFATVYQWLFEHVHLQGLGNPSDWLR